MKRQELIDEALSWGKTPFHHQGRLKGVGCDCLGFLSEAAKNLGVDIEIPADYKPRPEGNEIIEFLRNSGLFVQVQEKDILPGDLLAFQFADKIRHMAMYLEGNRIIHASNPEGVVDIPFADNWRSRFDSAWRFKQLED